MENMEPPRPHSNGPHDGRHSVTLETIDWLAMVLDIASVLYVLSGVHGAAYIVLRVGALVLRCAALFLRNRAQSAHRQNKISVVEVTALTLSLISFALIMVMPWASTVLELLAVFLHIALWWRSR